jgi:hypothetical protein
MPFVDSTAIILEQEKKEFDEAYANNPQIRQAIDEFDAECKLCKETRKRPKDSRGRKDLSV